MNTNKQIMTTQRFLWIITMSTLYLSLLGMERLIPLTPELSTSLFNPSKALKKGLPLHKFFNSTVTITPNEQSIIISHSGKVYKKDITSPLKHQQETIQLFKHPSTKLSTMIAVDETKDGNILIVSGGNYYNKEKEKWTSEIISYQDETYTIKEFNSPLQALKLSNEGTLLVAATLSSITLFNLTKKTMNTTGFEPFNGRLANATPHRIIDIDIAIANSAFIVAIGKYGIMQLMKINKEQTKLSLVKEQELNDDFTQLALVTPRSLLYTTKKSKAKIIDMFHFLDTENKNPATKFAHSAIYEQVSLDRFSQMSAHWTKNENLSEEERSTILIKRIINPKNSTRWDSEEEKIEPQIEHYKLSAHFSQSTYDFTSNTGKLEEHNSHILTVEIRKSTVIALVSTGEIFVWRLPEVPSCDTSNKEKISSLDNPSKQLQSDVYKATDTTTTTTISISTPNQIKKSTRRSSLGFITPRTPRNTSRSSSPNPTKLLQKKSTSERQNIYRSDGSN